MAAKPKPVDYSLWSMDQHLHAFMEAFVAKRFKPKGPVEPESKKAAKRRLRDEKIGLNPMLGMDNLWASLDERYCTQLPRGSADHDKNFVRQRIAKFNLRTCYVMSQYEPLHRLIMPVEEAIMEIVGNGPTSIISFVPGKVAYFEGHSVGDRWLCIREEKVVDNWP